MAVTSRIVAIAAGTGVHGGDEDEVGRERRGAQRAGDRHAAVLHRLSQDFQRATIELGEFIQE